MSYHTFAGGVGSFETYFVPLGQHPDGSGWYWRACFPGCLPDGEPSGPFATEEEALADAGATE